jgi:uncharacterized RDD family membrane protein YckC
LARLVDYIIVNIALGVLSAIITIPLWLAGQANPNMIAMRTSNNGGWWHIFVGPFTFAVNSLGFFAYWRYMKSKFDGQSIGKMLLHIKTTNLEGQKADIKSIAISSFGKSFLLVIDVFLGWIFTNDKRQRLLSRAANTIIIKIEEDRDSIKNISYRKD